MARRKQKYGSTMTGLSLIRDTPIVIGLRLAKLGRGGRGAPVEFTRMVTEKLMAAAQAQGIMARALLRGMAPTGLPKVTRLYAGKVAANRRRLAKGR
jgi:hypothetical protein